MFIAEHNCAVCTDSCSVCAERVRSISSHVISLPNVRCSPGSWSPGMKTNCHLCESVGRAGIPAVALGQIDLLGLTGLCRRGFWVEAANEVAPVPSALLVTVNICWSVMKARQLCRLGTSARFARGRCGLVSKSEIIKPSPQNSAAEHPERPATAKSVALRPGPP